jgi:hypothetical protein
MLTIRDKGILSHFSLYVTWSTLVWFRLFVTAFPVPQTESISFRLFDISVSHGEYEGGGVFRNVAFCSLVGTGRLFRTFVWNRSWSPHKHVPTHVSLPVSFDTKKTKQKQKQNNESNNKQFVDCYNFWLVASISVYRSNVDIVRKPVAYNPTHWL